MTAFHKKIKQNKVKLEDIDKYIMTAENKLNQNKHKAL